MASTERTLLRITEFRLSVSDSSLLERNICIQSHYRYYLEQSVYIYMVESNTIDTYINRLHKYIETHTQMAYFFTRVDILGLTQAIVNIITIQ